MTRKKKAAEQPVEEIVETDDILQHKKQRAFLSAYAKCGNITRAAQMADIARQTHYDWLAVDDAYKAAFAAADEEAGDYLEAEARRRAVEGWEEPVFHQGMEVGAVRKYSDSLLIFLMKGSKPEKYKDRVQSDVKATVDATITQKPDLSKLSDEELIQLEQLLNKTAQSG
jgi:hypothetical protein